MGYYVEILCGLEVSTDCSKDGSAQETVERRTLIPRALRKCDEAVMEKGWKKMSRGRWACPQCVEVLERRKRIKANVKELVKQIPNDGAYSETTN